MGSNVGCKAVFILTMAIACSGSAVCAKAGPGQEKSVAGAESSGQSNGDLRTLAEVIRQLQTQVQDMNSELRKLREEQQSARAETSQLRKELESATAQISAQGTGAKPTATYPTAPGAGEKAGGGPSVTDGTEATSADRWEEELQLAKGELKEQSQTKVESGSKYRVRLSGLALLNMFTNRGNVDNLDVPEIAVSQPFLESNHSFGGTLRQSQIGLQAFGPTIAGARTSADVRFDFAGSIPEAPNGVAFGSARLRTGTIRLDWRNTSVIAGQDALFLSPLSPTSLASVAVPALSYAGNLWSWTPQVRIEHRFELSERSSLRWQAGILDSFSGDVPAPSSERAATWGEMSGQPAYATRLAWTQHAWGQDITLGAGGYYGRQYWGFARRVDGWAGTLDLMVPMGKRFEFSGQFYRGRAAAGLGGAIGQDVVWNGSFIDPGTAIRGLDSMGGWAQVKFKPMAKFEVNGAMGVDNPFAGELRRANGVAGYSGLPLTKNLSPLFNVIYQPRSDVVFAGEYRRLKTYTLDSNANRANIVNLSVGYIF
jgi:hypothetical protein